MATETHTMLTTFLLIYLCVFTAPTCSSFTSPGMLEDSKPELMMKNPNPTVLLYYKATRKMLMTDVADYDETGANSRHDPRRGRSGRNP